MRIIAFILICFIAPSANAQTIAPIKKLNRQAKNIFALNDGTKIIISSHIKNRVSSVRVGESRDETKLRFLLPLDNSTEAYLYTTESSEILIIESNFYEPVGLSANILNLSFLLLSNRKIIDVQYCNTFFLGVAEIKEKKGSLVVPILRFNNFTDDDVPLCCLSNFLLDKSFKFTKLGESRCIEYHGNDSLINSDVCACKEENSVVVFDFKVGGN